MGASNAVCRSCSRPRAMAMARQGRGKIANVLSVDALPRQSQVKGAEIRSTLSANASSVQSENVKPLCQFAPVTDGKACPHPCSPLPQLLRAVYDTQRSSAVPPGSSQEYGVSSDMPGGR